MSQPIRISQLVTMSAAQLTGSDYFPIVDSGSQATQRITVESFQSFLNTGSFSGSGTAFIGTASYALAVQSASYALTASIASYAVNSQGSYDTIYVPVGHGIKIGHAIRKTRAAEYLVSINGFSTCSISGDTSGSEAIGVVVDSGSFDGSTNTLRVCYHGIADFRDDVAGNLATYLASPMTSGSVYFLNDGGELTSTEPTSQNSISKPMMISISGSIGLVTNQRGIRITPNNTLTSNTLFQQTNAGGSGSFSGSIYRPLTFMRSVFICDSPTVGYTTNDEVDVTCVYTSGSAANAGGLGIRSEFAPFLNIKTNIIGLTSSITGSFRHTVSWLPLISSGSSGSVDNTGLSASFEISKWKLKIYT